MGLVTEKPDNISGEKVRLAEPEEATEYRAQIIGGLSPDALPDPPERGEWRTYVVKARCVEHRYKTVNDADRLICVMEHDSIYEQGKVPIVDEKPGDPELDYESGADGEYSESYGTGHGEQGAAQATSDTPAEPQAAAESVPVTDATPAEQPSTDEATDDDGPTASVHDFPVFSGKSKAGTK